MISRREAPVVGAFLAGALLTAVAAWLVSRREEPLHPMARLKRLLRLSRANGHDLQHKEEA